MIFQVGPMWALLRKMDFLSYKIDLLISEKLRKEHEELKKTNKWREKECRRLLKIAKERLIYWQHIYLRNAKLGNTWFIEDQVELWAERKEKCQKRVNYFNRLKKAKKDEANGIVTEKPIEYDILRLKEAPILDVVKHYGYQVKMAGINRAYIKLRQNERTPSCCLSLDKNIFHDFGSGDHGDVIDFVGRHRGTR